MRGKSMRMPPGIALVRHEDDVHYWAYIFLKGKCHSLGFHDTMNDAWNARQQMEGEIVDALIRYEMDMMIKKWR